MIRKKLLFLSFFLFLIGVLTLHVGPDDGNKANSENSLDVSTVHESRSTHKLRYFDKYSFYNGVEQADGLSKRFVHHVSGGIVPHHLLAGFIISDFFTRLAIQNPKTIILIGPNHYEQGRYKVLSSIFGWKTPFGVVEPNESVIQELEASNLLKIDEEVMSHDHAVAGIMPYIKYYLPQARVVPMLVSGFMSEKETSILSKSLKRYVDEDTVFMASVDFSHYMRNRQAQENDMVTLGLMKNFQYGKLLSLGNDYLDSPPSIAVLLMTMQGLDTANMEMLHHTSSGARLGNDALETTSYFSAIYY